MKNIVLIGMSGVGKTEKGKLISQFLGWDFIDTDELIVEREKISIDDIFLRFGEDYFRDIEMKVIEEVSNLENTVISTGGGVVVRDENIKHLRKNGYIFLLMGKVETIVNNLNKSNIVRPLLKKDLELYDKVERLLKSRENLYILSSDVLLNIDDKSIDEVCRVALIEYDKLNKIYN